jgi:hypothetical protein
MFENLVCASTDYGVELNKFASEIRNTQHGISNACEIIFHMEPSSLSLNTGGYFEYHLYERT